MIDKKLHVNRRTRHYVCLLASCTILFCSSFICLADGQPVTSLTLIPPSPVTDKIKLDIRGAIWNHTSRNRDFNVRVYLDNITKDSLLFDNELTVAAKTAEGIRFRWDTAGNAGPHNIIMQVKDDKSTWKEIETIEIISSDVRSTRTIDGAWTDFTAVLPGGSNSITGAKRRDVSGIRTLRK